MASRHNSGMKKSLIMANIEAAKLQDDDSSLQDSWVDLAEPPSRGSTSSVTMYTDPGLLIDAQRSTAVSRHSPKSLQSPNVEFDTTLEAVKYKLARDILPPGRNTDWIWDWSSRPEAQAPKEFRFRHPGSCSLTTPPNSPINYESELSSYLPLSLRHSKWIRREWFSVEILSFFLVSNVVTFVLGVCVGVFVLRRCYPPSY